MPSRHALDQALGSARLDGLADSDPRFVAFLAAYATGEIDRDQFDARLAAVVAATLEEEQP